MALRVAGLLVMTMRYVDAAPELTDIGRCPRQCSNHGKCWWWPTEPRFPAICFCDPQYEGHACETRQRNPYPSVASNPLKPDPNGAKYATWKRTNGVACGGDRHAPSCAQCVPSGAVDANRTAMEELCGGECYWALEPQRCLTQPAYSPFKTFTRPSPSGHRGRGVPRGRPRATANSHLHLERLRSQIRSPTGGRREDERPDQRSKVRDHQPGATFKGRLQGDTSPNARMLLRLHQERLQAAAAATQGRLSGLRDPLRRGSGRASGRGGAGNGRGGAGAGGRGGVLADD